MPEHIDPPDMPEGERMTDAEFRVAREHLGLTGDWLAAHLGVNPRTVRSWEQGRYPIPDGVRLEMRDLGWETAKFVDRVSADLEHEANPTLSTYRSDAEYQAAEPDAEYPASWHRAACARIAERVPELTLRYPAVDDPKDLP